MINFTKDQLIDIAENGTTQIERDLAANVLGFWENSIMGFNSCKEVIVSQEHTINKLIDDK
jgi:hypothetical protein